MKMKSLGGSILAAVLAVSTAVSGLSVTAATAQSVVEESAVLVSASTTVSITTASGDLESAYAQWSALSGAEGYNVYVKKSGGSYTQIDTMLVREYPSYFRADVPGLAAGSYTLKVVPVISGKEDTSKASETASLTVEAHDRTGFAFVSNSKYTSTTASGAYNDDGTLKSNAVVLYITEDTKNTVTLDVTTSSKGATTTAVGVQNILTAYQKGYDSRPLDLRFIGNITDPDTLMDGDLLVKGNGASKRLSCGVTVEGIGNDTVFNGFGLRIANASNVEVRNLGFMNCNSDEGDDVGLQQNNDHIWVHNCDFFYGDAGSDADQVKGDGALDTKTSTYITHSYNHFWDNGKCNLQGMKSESTENYITYHHNWYDHSDSRHPRIRTCSVHSYNNYFDGNAKYGVGVTLGASAYVEANYFRNCKNPMLISGQGTDALGAGTFSGEAGGIIKAYANVIVGASSYITYAEDNTEFDAYEVSSASETIPSTVKSVSGGNTYNNFDTDSSIMYSYTADAAEDVPSIVTAKAGRVQGGDFQWEFDNSVDDTSYAVNDALKAALTAYTTSIVSIGSGYTTDGSSANTPVTTTASTTATKATTTTTTTSTTGATSVTTVTTKATVATTTVDVVTEGDIFCSPTGTGTGETASDPASVTDAISRLTPGHTIYLLAGTYSFSETILIDQNNCGTADAMKTIKNYNGAKVVFDFSGQEIDGSNRGIVLDGNYWHFYGFEITKAGDNGMLLSGSNNKLERMVFNDNQDTGLQISRYRSSAETIDTWPSNNLILNCTSKNNCDDLTMENADGFAAKLTCGEGNVFDGCMSYNNSDDGWDLFAKSATGPIGVVTIQNCIAFRNGYTEFGEGYGDCDGNGFKLGGSGVGSAHVVINCLAFENLNCGFTDNNNPKLDTLINCTSYNNGVGANGKPNVSCYRCTDDGCDFSNLISYYSKGNLTSNLGATGLTKISNDKFVGTIQNAVYYNSGYYLVTDKTDVTNNEKVGTKGCTISDSDFASVVAPEMGTDFDIVWRNADGSITTQGFMQVVESSDFYSIRGAVFDTVETPVVTTTAPEETSATTTTTASSVHTSTAPNSSTAAIDSETETTTVATTSPASTDSEEIEATTTTTTTTVAVSSETTAESQDTSASSSSVESGETTTTTKETQGTTSEGSEGMLLYGDVNLDGRVDVTDAVLLNKAAAGAVQLNSIQFQNADCFSDSTLTGEDAQSLMRFLVHLVDSLPIFE